MTLLDTHLEQIQLCASTIGQLPFPPPKMFTNAMLHNRDITALLRDTEAHERALFSLAREESIRKKRRATAVGKRRNTAFPGQVEESKPEYTFRAPRRGTAVAAVLGGSLNERIRLEYQRDHHDARRGQAQQTDDFDVELLLTGAERLCSVYPIAGALDRIALLRSRNAKVTASLDEYEHLVAEQTTQLGRMNGASVSGLDDEADEEVMVHSTQSIPTEMPTSEEDLRREEEGIAELERRKRTLEERVSGIEKDLGGLMR